MLLVKKSMPHQEGHYSWGWGGLLFLGAPEHAGRPGASILRGLRKQPGTSLLLLSIMLSFSPPHPSVIHALATYALFHLSTVFIFTRATAKQSTCTCPKEPTPAYGHPSKEGSRTYPLSGKEPTPAYGHPSKEGSRTYPLSGKEPTPAYGHPSKEGSSTYPLSGGTHPGLRPPPSEREWVAPCLGGVPLQTSGVGCPRPGPLRQAQDHLSKEGITYKVTQYAGKGSMPAFPPFLPFPLF